MPRCGRARRGAVASCRRNLGTTPAPWAADGREPLAIRRAWSSQYTLQPGTLQVQPGQDCRGNKATAPFRSGTQSSRAGGHLPRG